MSVKENTLVILERFDRPGPIVLATPYLTALKCYLSDSLGIIYVHVLLIAITTISKQPFNYKLIRQTELLNLCTEEIPMLLKLLT